MCHSELYEEEKNISKDHSTQGITREMELEPKIKLASADFGFKASHHDF